jgi:hypothetical protein
MVLSMPPQSFQFSTLFLAIFAATALKLGSLLCSKELQFQLAFQCDLFIFARVTSLELTRILRIFQFSKFSTAIFSASTFGSKDTA